MASGTVHKASQWQKRKYASYLAQGEEIIAVFGIGRKYFWYNFVPVFILSFGLIGMPFLLKLLHLRHRLTYILTDRRVVIKDGIFSTKITTAPYDKITHITVRQDFISRISFGIGDIIIHTAGPTPVAIDLIKVQDPMRVKNLIEELIVKERSLLGTVMDKDPLVHPLN